MMKRYIAICLAMIVMVGLLFITIPRTEAAEETSISRILNTLPLRDVSYNYDDDGVKSSMFSFSPGLLLVDARTVGNKPVMGEIAKASVALAMAAYNRSYINGMLKTMGFTAYDNSAVYNRSANYLTVSDNDYVAYTIAYQDVTNPVDGKTYRLYCVPIQGTPQNAEWFSDFNLGIGVEHEGFYKASWEVYNQLLSYFAEDGKSAETRIVWLTGHSRGAACSNLIAGWLSYSGAAYTKAEHVFGYTYACPGVSLQADTTLTNIYNFNNKGDMVTMLPMSEWGYRRNGQDILLDTSETQLNNVRQQFKTITGQTYASEISDTNYKKLLTGIVGTDLDEFNNSAALHTVMGIVAWALGGKNDAKFFEVLREYMPVPNVLESALQAANGNLNDIHLMLIQRGNAYDQMSQWAHQAYSDTHLGMTQEEFQAYLEANSDMVAKLEAEAVIKIEDAQGFLTANNLLQEAKSGIRSVTECISAAMQLLTDENGNVLDKILHGHAKTTYIVWTNSLYFGYRGWYNNDEIQIADAKSVCLSVGQYAFYGCDQLNELSLPNTIGSNAAANCPGLRTVTLPVDYNIAARPFNSYTNGVTTIRYTYGQTGVMKDRDNNINSYSYYGSTLEYYSKGALKTIEFAEGITHIGALLFYGGTSVLKTVQLPSTIQTIGDYAFNGCSAVTDINLGDKVTSIGNYAFSGCSSLTSTVSFAEGLHTIGTGAFQNCVKLNITDAFPASLTVISGHAFYNCDGITKVTIPETVTTIGINAFYDCDNLAELTLPDVPITMGSSPFGNCRGLRTVTLPVDYNIAARPFNSYTNGVTTIHYTCGQTGVMKDRNNDINSGSYYGKTLEYYSRGALKTIEFADGITHIGSCLFRHGSTILKTVQLPSTIQTIGDYAFYNCSAVTDINLGDKVTSIGNCAFSGCSSLTSTVTFTEGLHAIGIGAFQNCVKLNITDSFPQSLTVISDSAFTNCDGITKVTIPETVTLIGINAFYDCNNLAELTLPDVPITMGSSPFGNCSGLRTVTLPVDYNIAARPFNANTNGVTTIHYTCGQTGVMKDWNNDINSGSYYGKTLEYYSRGALKTIEFAEGITHIGSCLFREGSSVLKTVQLPSTIQSIGDYAFNNCSALSEVFYCGTQEQWAVVTLGASNSSLTKIALQFHNMENGVCTICGHQIFVAGDMDGNEVVDHNDAIYLLLHTMFGEEAYPLHGADADIDANGIVDQEDAVYLLLHTMFGEAFYPLRKV